MVISFALVEEPFYMASFVTLRYAHFNASARASALVLLNAPHTMVRESNRWRSAHLIASMQGDQHVRFYS
jgi:hypothetical protein